MKTVIIVNHNGSECEMSDICRRPTLYACEWNSYWHVTFQGRSQDLGGGGTIIFFQNWKYACRGATYMLRMAKPYALLGGFGVMSPREIFLKWCNLVRFDVYFDPILSLNFFKNYHFLYKK